MSGWTGGSRPEDPAVTAQWERDKGADEARAEKTEPIFPALHNDLTVTHARLALANAKIERVWALLNDPGGPDSWSHTFQGRQALFADDVRQALEAE